MTAPRIPAAHLQAIMDALEAIGAHKAEVKSTGALFDTPRLAVIALEEGWMAQPRILLMPFGGVCGRLPIEVGHLVYMQLRRMRDQQAETPRHAFSL